MYEYVVVAGLRRKTENFEFFRESIIQLRFTGSTAGFITVLQFYRYSVEAFIVTIVINVILTLHGSYIGF